MPTATRQRHRPSLSGCSKGRASRWSATPGRRAFQTPAPNLWPQRFVLVARELTKLHEELIRGPVGEMAERFSEGKVKGEVTVVVAGASEVAEAAPQVSPADLARWLADEGLPPGRIAAALSRFCGLPRDRAYQIATSTASRKD